MDDEFPVDWDYPQDDIESEFLIFDLIDTAAQTIDFHNATPFVKLSWMFCVTKYPIVEE